MTVIGTARVSETAIGDDTTRYDQVVRRLAAQRNLSQRAARDLFGEMLRFLDSASASTDPVAPPKEVDAAWHLFILHTRDYAEYCGRRFGRFIHHVPTGAGDDATQPAGGRPAAGGPEGDCKPGADCTPEADCTSGDCQTEGNCTADCNSEPPADA
jgi:hypothetical protein